MFGARGAGNNIGGDGPTPAQFGSSSITIGPGVPLGKINGGGGAHGCGMDTTMDGGGPRGTMIGGGLADFLGRLMYIGPGAGAGTTICGGGGGSGGNRAKTVCGQFAIDEEPEPGNDFNNGDSNELGSSDIVDGADLDAAASSTRTASGGNWPMAAGEDATAVSRAMSAAGGKVS